MTKRFNLFTFTVIALVLCSGVAVNAVEAVEADVEQTTESPIADMALVDSGMEGSTMGKQQAMPDSAQPHTVADFIIHPLIALKPRVQEEPASEGKQASSTTTPAPWQLFGFNPGQGLGLGSSVQSLAGTVSGWLGNRIQLPGLIDTPVGESTTTTTTTTTTPRPDVVVRVQHRRTTRRPLINFDDQSRPHRFSDNNLYDTDDYDVDDYDDDFDNDYREYDEQPEFDSEEEDDQPDEEEDEDESDDEDQRPVRKQKPKRRRPSQSSGNKNTSSSNKRKSNKKKRGPTNKRKRPQPEESEEEVDDEDTENDDDDEEDNDQDFYYNNNNNNNNHGSTKRSQSQQGFIQLGQQSLINQIRQLTRGQTPAEVGSTIRKSPMSSTPTKRRQQATLIINRNGQTVYLAPELMNAGQGANVVQQVPFYTTSGANTNKRPVTGYPQPPLTVPLKRKGKPTQYITIPWSQLGISPPNQLVSVTEGIQSQPLILNIPQSALDAMQNQRPGQRKPVITTEAVPLLAEASLMDVFKPPQIPPARTPSSTKGTKKISSSVTPVLISTKTKQRIRPGTIVEMAPDMDSMRSQHVSMSDDSSSNDNEGENQFLVVGDDAEPGLGRQAYPVVGETRQYQALNPYVNVFHSRPYRVRNGRQLMEAEAEASVPSEAMPMMTAKAEDSTPSEAVVEAMPMMAAEMMPSEQPATQTEVVMADSPATAVLDQPAQETPIAPSAEQLIPVQVVSSESDIVTIPEVEAKPEETKTE